MGADPRERALRIEPLLAGLHRIERLVPEKRRARSVALRKAVPRAASFDLALGELACELRLVGRGERVTVRLEPENGFATCTCDEGWASEAPCEHVAAVASVLADRLERGGCLEADRTADLIARLERVLSNDARPPRPVSLARVSWRVRFDTPGFYDSRIGPTLVPRVRRRLKGGTRGARREITLEELARARRTKGAAPQDLELACRAAAIAETLAPGHDFATVPTLELLAGHPRVFVDGRRGEVVRARAGLAVVAAGAGLYEFAATLDGRPVAYDRRGTGAHVGAEGVLLWQREERRLVAGSFSPSDGGAFAALARSDGVFEEDAVALLLHELESRGFTTPIEVPAELAESLRVRRERAAPAARALEALAARGRARPRSSREGRRQAWVPLHLAPGRARGTLAWIVRAGPRGPVRAEVSPEGGTWRCTCHEGRGPRPCAHVTTLAGTLARRLDRAGWASTRNPLPGTSTFHWWLRRLTDAPRPEPSRRADRLAWHVSIDPRWGGIGVSFRALRASEPVRPTTGTSRQAEALATVELMPGAPPQDRRLVALAAAAAEERWCHCHVLLPSWRALELLAGHPDVRLGPDARTVAVERAGVGLVVLRTPDGAYRLDVAVDGRPVRPLGAVAHVTGHGLLVELAHEGRLLVGSCREEARHVVSFLREARVALPLESMAQLVEHLEGLDLGLPLVLPPELRPEPVPADPSAVVRLTPRRSGAEVELLVRSLRGARARTPGVPGARVTALVDGWRLVAERRIEDEVELARDVAATLELREGPGSPWSWHLEDDDAVLDLVARFDERLSGREDVDLEWPADEARPRVARVGPRALRVDVTSRGDWFGLTGQLAVDGATITLAALLGAAREGRRYVALGDGRHVAIASVLAGRAADLSLLVREDARRGLTLPRVAVPVAAVLLEEVARGRVPEAWRSLARAGAGPPPDESAVVDPLGDVLRPYQLEGFRWLRRLSELGLGACLADEMGLGKTVQAIAALVARSDRGPALVVAPTSVVPVWRDELARLAPALRVAIWGEADDRPALLEGAGPSCVVLASYSLVQRDAELLRRVPWATLVLDEAQAIKNVRTGRHEAVLGLRAEWTLALSGTPVENDLAELFALFRVIVPGLLGTWSEFRERFAVEGAGALGRERRAALSRLIRPFVLRRTKKDVLRDLPARLEVRVDVELGPAERALYERARLEALGRLARASGKAAEKGRFEILAELTRLRLIASNASLVDSGAPAVSAKVAALVERLEPLVAEGRASLVFSQFTRNLDKIAEVLDTLGVAWLRLDGSTPAAERPALVERFQRGAAPVFLISLRAGGTGLTLTAADTAFLLDPWWNPAVEQQAGDRAHRIGQTRTVTVVRLVARGTIEEAVLALHERKRELVESVLEGLDRPSAISVEELRGLIGEPGG